MNTLNVKAPAQIGPYILRGVIGEGAFSVVQLAYLQSEQRYYACKIVPKSHLSHDLESRFETEIRINQQMHHPGIVQLIDIFKDENNYYVIMEFCANGELFQYIVDRKRLREEEAKGFIYQIFETVNFVHKLNVAHRDLKPENILIDQLGHLKLSDFGLSNFVNVKTSLVSTPCGSPCYASPECLSGKPYNGKTNDVWSCGVILYTMVTGQLPWTKRNQNELFQQIKRGEYNIPNYISDKCKSLIKGLMRVDITKRLTLEQAMKHEWFDGKNYGSSNQPSHFIAKIVSLRKVDLFFDKVIEAEISKADYLRKNQSTCQLTFDKFRYLQQPKVVRPPQPPVISSPTNRIRSGMKVRHDTNQETIPTRDRSKKLTIERKKRYSQGLPSLSFNNRNDQTSDDLSLQIQMHNKLSSALTSKRGQSVTPRLPKPRDTHSSISNNHPISNTNANAKMKTKIRNPVDKNYQSPRFAIKKNTEPIQEKQADFNPTRKRTGSARRNYNPATGNFEYDDIGIDKVNFRIRTKKTENNGSPLSSPIPSPKKPLAAPPTTNNARNSKKLTKQEIKPPAMSSVRRVTSARKTSRLVE